MGKGIIFVGSGNLNRNKDQQSMYQYGYRNQRQKDSRTLFTKNYVWKVELVLVKKEEIKR